MAWIIPARPAPRVRLTSPSGLPSFARAAGAMKMGEVEGRPRRVVEVSHLETSTKMRGRKSILRNAFVFSYFAKIRWIRTTGAWGEGYRAHRLRRKKSMPMLARRLSVERISEIRSCTEAEGYLEIVDVYNLMNWRDFLRI